MIKSSTKPGAWTVSPQMTAAPELWRGCKLFLPMWEGSGKAVRDLSGYDNHTQMTNMSDASWILSSDGRSIEFDATDDYLAGNTLNGLSSTLFSIAAKVYPTGNHENDNGYIYLSGPVSDNEQLVFSYGPDERLSFTRNWSGGQGQWFKAGTLPVNVDTSFVITYDGSSTANDPIFYINGIQETGLTEFETPSGSLVKTGTAQFTIGNRRSDTARTFQGYMHYLGVWDRILTADEAKQLARDPYSMIQPAGF